MHSKRYHARFRPLLRCLAPAALRRVSEVVTSMADPGANIIFGAVVDDQSEGEVHVTIIATGFPENLGDTIVSDKVVLPPSTPAPPTYTPFWPRPRVSICLWVPFATPMC